MKEQKKSQNPKVQLKPQNRNMFTLQQGITIDSMFPSGNIAYAKIINYDPLNIQIKGNSDHSNDSFTRYWLYFRMKGYIKGTKIIFLLKDANHLRKFFNCDKTFLKPIMTYKINDTWKQINTQLEIKIVQENKIQASFQFMIDNQEEIFTNQQNIVRDINQTRTSFFAQEQKQIVPQVYIAINYPYTQEDLEKYTNKVRQLYNTKYKLIIQKLIKTLNLKNEFENQLNIQHYRNIPYFNEETLIYSFERRKVSLITITSILNVQSFSQRQPKIDENLFPNLKDRPYKLKNLPIIFISGRVHPSQVASSYFIEGVIDFLMNSDHYISQILKKMFIFVIIPCLNPDGVSNGNYRHDNNLKNLNRFYGVSNFQSTPQIKATQILINYYKNFNAQSINNQENRLMFYFDVHGHQSNKSSFLFGNFSQNPNHFVENKLLCKLIEKNFIKNGFKSSECDFSKNNLNVKEKYDQNSKLHSGRAFAGSFSLISQSDEKLNRSITFHAYTLELSPYCLIGKKSLLNSKNGNKNIKKLPTLENQSCLMFQQRQINNLPDYAFGLAQSFLTSIAQIMGFYSNNNIQCENQKQITQLRSYCCREIIQQFMKLKNQSGHIKKYQKLMLQVKQLNKQILQDQKWFLEQNYYKTMFKCIQQDSFLKKFLYKFKNQNKIKDFIFIKYLFSKQTKSKKKIFNKNLKNLSITKFNINDQSLKSNQSIDLNYINGQPQISFSFRKIIKKNNNQKLEDIKNYLKDQIKIQKSNIKGQKYQSQFLGKTKLTNYRKLNQIVISDNNHLCLQSTKGSPITKNNNGIMQIKNQLRRKKKQNIIRMKTQDYIYLSQIQKKQSKQINMLYKYKYGQDQNSVRFSLQNQLDIQQLQPNLGYRNSKLYLQDTINIGSNLQNVKNKLKASIKTQKNQDIYLNQMKRNKISNNYERNQTTNRNYEIKINNYSQLSLKNQQYQQNMMSDKNLPLINKRNSSKHIEQSQFSDINKRTHLQQKQKCNFLGSKKNNIKYQNSKIRRSTLQKQHIIYFPTSGLNQKQYNYLQVAKQLLKNKRTDLKKLKNNQTKRNQQKSYQKSIYTNGKYFNYPINIFTLEKKNLL